MCIIYVFQIAGFCLFLWEETTIPESYGESKKSALALLENVSVYSFN